jgi:hypothetical protein
LPFQVSVASITELIARASKDTEVALMAEPAGWRDRPRLDGFLKIYNTNAVVA